MPGILDLADSFLTVLLSVFPIPCISGKVEVRSKGFMTLKFNFRGQEYSVGDAVSFLLPYSMRHFMFSCPHHPAPQVGLITGFKWCQVISPSRSIPHQLFN